jgi:hypothetical protein
MQSGLHGSWSVNDAIGSVTCRANLAIRELSDCVSPSIVYESSAMLADWFDMLELRTSTAAQILIEG